MLTITPTIGRRVLLFIGTVSPADGTPRVNNSAVPFDAGIVYVHSADSPGGQSMINVGFRDHNGVPHSYTSVRLFDRAQDTADVHGKDTYAVWMPFQFEQAQRALAPKVAPAGRAQDIELVKLEENGVLTDAGRERMAEAEQRQDDAARAVGQAD